MKAFKQNIYVIEGCKTASLVLQILHVLDL